MRKRLVRKTLDMLKEIAARDNDDYDTFWDAFGRNLKLGVIEDAANRDALGALLRFQTSKTETGKTKGLDAYVEAMPEGQSSIYYVAADTRGAAENSPFLEQLTKKGYEVLFMIDPIDEVAMQNLTQYKEKKLVDISKEDLDLGEEDEDEKKKSAEIEEEYKPLTDWILETLGADKVEKVAVSKRLTDTPCILVTSKFGWSANMERIMKAQAMGDNRAQEYMKGKKTMEINPTSPVILDLKAKQAAGDDRAKATAELLFDTALLTSGACHAVTCDRTQTPNYHAITNRSTPFVHTAQVSTSTNPRRSRLRSSTSWARCVYFILIPVYVRAIRLTFTVLCTGCRRRRRR